jgi:type II secretory pathway component PulL
MSYALQSGMDTSVIAFVLMAVATAVLLAATVAREADFNLPALSYRGDTSLSRQSVNWLAAIAFTAAILICLIRQ